jgi:BirA family biotin operon repressor/biotin-[acetyl-CoA-carboxylase] ligase
VKSELLQIFRQEKKPVSVENLGARLKLGVSALKKQIAELQNAGYEIIASKNGYQLVHDGDFLFPWEFPEREGKIHFFRELPSTMDIARDMARKGCPDFTVVIAEFQSKGRGRMQRVWQSDQGGLYFTIVLRPDMHPSKSFRINFAASLVLASVLKELFHIKARVKWPNDILVGNRKISGMLSEVEADAGKLTFVNLGIGINVNNEPGEYEQKAVSVKQCIGRTAGRKKLLSCFLDEFEKQFSGKPLDNIISQWKKAAVTLGRHVRVVTLQETLEGVAVDVDENGTLILKQKDGTVKQVIYGDCFHRPKH